MGNQQVSDTAKAWLGGIIDGEGTICISVQETKDGTKLSPCVGIVNTEPNMINLVANLFKAMNVGYHITMKPLTRKNANHQNQFLIRVRGIKRIHSLLTQMAPFIAVKQEQCRLMLQFVEFRLTLPGSPRTGRRFYRDWELELSERISELNRKAHLRDYKPDFLGIEIEDIVRTDMRVSEPFREMRPPDMQMQIWS